MLDYCTLADAKNAVKANLSIEDDILRGLIGRVSRRVDRLMGGRSTRPFFGPYVEARQILMTRERVSHQDGTFLLDWPLLAFTAVTAGGTTVTTVVEGFPQGEPVFSLLRLTNDYSWWDYLDDCDPTYVTVTGTWGYHSDWSNAWQSPDTLNGGINASVTALTVNDVDGADSFGFTPRYSAGHLLKVNDEYMFATATDTGAETINVVRGALGTTAAAHSNGDAVETFEVEEPVRRMVERQAGFLLARRGNYEASEFDGVRIATWPRDLLTEMAAIVSEYQYVRP